MTNALTEKLQGLFSKLRGYGKLSEENVADAVREVRLALVAADVHYETAKALCEEIKKRAVGQEVLTSIRPGEQFVKIFHDTLVEKLSSGKSGLSQERPLRILMCGLNGAGKTTTAGKLARWLQKQGKRRIALVAGDLARPAAIEQLRQLAARLEVDFVSYPNEQDPAAVASRALADPVVAQAQAIIFDAAGRMEVDADLLAELERVAVAFQPHESLLVADAATGQTAFRVAQAFHAKVPLTGIILSKADADVRGGAALSFHQATGLPIKFLGVGEGMEALEAFDAQRIVGRLLGMGDIVGLVEKAQEAVDVASAEKLAEKLKGNRFDLQDFLDQLRFLKKLGPLQGLMGMIPGMPKMPTGVDGDRMMRRTEAIILSMTRQERKSPDVLNGRRRQRIAAGSGTQVADVNELVKRFTEMKKMMGQLAKGGGMGAIGKLLSGKGVLPGGRSSS